MHKRRLLTRLVSGVAAVAVAGGSVLLVNGVAGAVPPPGTEGFNTISPATGTDTTPMSSMTSGPCPSQSTNASLDIVGPVGPDETAPDTATFPSSRPFPITTINNVQYSEAGPFVQQFQLLLRDAAAQRGTTIQVGEYHLTTNCFDEFGIEVFGTFTAGLTFGTPTTYTVIPGPTPTPEVTPTPGATPTPEVTPTPGATPTPEATPTPTPGETATTTTLRVFPNPAFQFFPVIALVNVSPSGAAGTVQLKDGTTNIGGPAPVFGGFALLFTWELAKGTHELTAEFTPADSAVFGPSTSPPVSLRVRGLFNFLFRW